MGEKRQHGQEGRWERDPPSPLQSLASPSPEPGHRLEAEAELRRSSCHSAGCILISSQPTVPSFFQFQVLLAFILRIFQILLFNHLLGITPHLTARDTHKHHFAC